MRLTVERVTKTIRHLRVSTRDGSAAFVDAEPHISVATPPPAAGAYPPHEPRTIAGRTRIATCGGVAWLGGGHLLTVNLRGDVMHAWTYEPDASPRRLLSGVKEIALQGFKGPENLAAAADGSLVAVTFRRAGTMHVYRADAASGTIDPAPVLALGAAGDTNLHGVAFSPCGRYLAYTTVDGTGVVRVWRIRQDAAGGTLAASEVTMLASRWPLLKPKGVAFSPDGRFVAIGYGSNVALKKRTLTQPGTVQVHGFDCETGQLDPHPAGALPRRARLVCAEDVSFLADGTGIVVTDQATDRALIASFDPVSGETGARRQILGNADAKLSFPHGCAVSPDGLYMAIACYGTDRANLYRLTDHR